MGAHMTGNPHTRRQPARFGRDPHDCRQTPERRGRRRAEYHTAPGEIRQERECPISGRGCTSQMHHHGAHGEQRRARLSRTTTVRLHVRPSALCPSVVEHSDRERRQRGPAWRSSNRAPRRMPASASLPSWHAYSKTCSSVAFIGSSARHGFVNDVGSSTENS